MHPQLFKLNDKQKAEIAGLLKDAGVLALIEKNKGASDSGSFTGMIISTQGVDRDGDTLIQAGIDTSAYMTNPVILNSHVYRGIENIIGVTTKLYPGTVNGLPVTHADGTFAPTEAGQLARMLFEQGFLNAASVGFIPTEYAAGDNRVITKSELLEWSFVPVPANAGATARRARELGLDMEVLVAKGFALKEEAVEVAKCKECGEPADAAEQFQSKEHPTCNKCLAQGWIELGVSVTELSTKLEGLEKILADNGGKGKKTLTVDELLRHPDFHPAVLKAIDKALGVSLRDINRAKS